MEKKKATLDLRSPGAGDLYLFWVLVGLVLKVIYDRVEDWESTNNARAAEGCLIWAGAGEQSKAVVNRPWVRRLDKGLGVGNQIYVREFLFELVGGKPPSRAMRTPTLSNVCDCKQCMSPEHSKWVTRAQVIKTAADRTQYGKDPIRSMRLSRARQEYNQREGIGLTREQVNIIRQNPGKRPADLARQLGAKASTIADCRRLRTYKLTQDQIAAVQQCNTEPCATQPAAPFSALLIFAMDRPPSISRSAAA